MPSTRHLTPLRRVQTGWGIATTTTTLAPIVLFVLSYQRGGPVLLAACSVTMSVLGVLAASEVGHLAERHDLATVLRWTMSLGSAAMVVAAAAALAGWTAVVTVGFGSLSVALFSTYRPLQAAALPWLVHTPQELARANVVAVGIENAAALVGPALAGVALFALSAGPAMAACAVFALTAPLPLLGLSVLRPRPARRVATKVRDSYAAGLVALWRAVPGGAAFVLSALQTFARGALQVLLVILVLQTFQLADDSVGWLWAAMGVGGLLGALLGAKILRVSRLARGFVIGVVLWGVGLVVLARAGSSPAVAGIGMFVIGVGNALEDASAFTLVARRATRGTAVRALAAIEIVAFTSAALGAVAAPGLTHLTGGGRATLIIGLVVLVVAAGYGLTARRLDHAAAEPDPYADLLSHVGVFDVLPVAVVEHLASRLECNSYDTGAVVMREGDLADSYHVVASGTALVTVAGAPRPALGPGDGFGEIALLRESPRTATITAAGPLTTYSLERDDFLTAIQGRSGSVESLAALRLSRDSRS